MISGFPIISTWPPKVSPKQTPKQPQREGGEEGFGERGGLDIKGGATYLSKSLRYRRRGQSTSSTNPSARIPRILRTVSANFIASFVQWRPKYWVQRQSGPNYWVQRPPDEQTSYKKEYRCSRMRGPSKQLVSNVPEAAGKATPAEAIGEQAAQENGTEKPRASPCDGLDWEIVE